MSSLQNDVALSGKLRRPELQFQTVVVVSLRGHPRLRYKRFGIWDCRWTVKEGYPYNGLIKRRERVGLDFGIGSGRLTEFGRSHLYVALENVVE